MADNQKIQYMPNNHHYKKLKVWQDSVALSIQLYTATKLFPHEEQFGLVSQLRRAAISVPSNIAEGSKRGTKKDFISFLRIAHGSGAEIETQLLIAKELHFIEEEEYKKLTILLESIMGMLASFITTLSKSDI